MRPADPKTGDCVRAHAVDPMLALEHDLAGGRAVKPLDQAQQRALAGAVRADDAEQLVGRDLEGEVADRCDAAEALRDPTYGERRS
jgi:hypothetical protein